MATAGESIEKLAATLGYERGLLEYLLFKLVSANLVRVAGEHRFFGPATTEVDTVVAEIRRAAELRREMAASIAREWNVPVRQIDLGFLAEHAPSRFQGIFKDLQDAFGELNAEIRMIAGQHAQLGAFSFDDIDDIAHLVAADSDGPGDAISRDMTDQDDRSCR